LLIVGADASELAVLGAGTQAFTHVLAIAVVRQLSRVRLWARNPDKARELAAALRPHLPAACALDVCDAGVQAAVAGAPIIAVCTGATEPVLFGAWVAPGATVCAVGACRPQWREMDDELMCNADVIADSRAGAMSESGDVVLSGCSVYAELGELVAGTVQPPARGRTVVFKSLGVAVEDAAAAAHVLRA
jgi:ornithine cyclodeaminase/alanine dehydrogenase-like protein (mu-crystallin family)